MIVDILDDPLIMYLYYRATQNTAYGIIGPVGNSARAREGQTSGKDTYYIHIQAK